MAYNGRVRYLLSNLQKDLKKKMVVLAGPRQCGKTTLAKSLLDKNGEYLNWDITTDRKIIRDIAWPKDASIVVLDELHKAPKWKNLLKGVADEFANTPPILVTGSARLDALRKTGDALTGRHYFYRLHPIDVAESRRFLPGISLADRVQRLLQTGGFPEAFLHPEESLRLRNDRMELIVKEDSHNLSQISSWRGAVDLVELLRASVGKPVNYDSLARDLGISPPTVRNWITLLENLYIVFLIPPYSRHLTRSIRKEKRAFFYDCAAAYDDTQGAQLENLAACCLLKYIQFKRDATGENWGLFYLRDKEKREVDFVVTLNQRVHWLIEVKKSDDAIGNGLKYYTRRLKPKESIQLVLHLDRAREKSGIKILPLGEWLDALG